MGGANQPWVLETLIYDTATIERWRIFTWTSPLYTNTYFPHSHPKCTHPWL